jgi:hypothetical protein
MYIKELAVFGLSSLEMVHDVSFVQHGIAAAAATHHAAPFLFTFNVVMQALAPTQRPSANCLVSLSHWTLSCPSTSL